jgi:hypothetical protein
MTGVILRITVDGLTEHPFTDLSREQMRNLIADCSEQICLGFVY